MLIWSSGFVGIAASLKGGFNSGHLVLFRFLVASTALLLIILIRRAPFRLPDKSDIFRIFIVGFIGITTYHVFLTFGQQTVSAGTTGMIIGTAPIFTTILAMIMLRERLEWFGWLGLGIGFVGMFLITLGTADSGFSISKGTIFIFIGALATSSFFVLQKPLLRKYKPVELTAYFTWAGTLPMLFFAPGLLDTIKSATLGANLSAIYVGVFPAAIAYIIWSTALSLGDASKVTTLMYIEPVFVIIIAWIWLNEWPETISLIGGAIAISSVAIVNIIGNRVRRVST